VTDTPTERQAQGPWAKLRRRKVVQWGIAYAAAAWTLLQVLEYFGETYAWPRAVRQIAGLAIPLGLLFVLVLAWYHGDKGDQKVSRTELAILAMLVAVMGGTLWWYVSRLDESAWVADTGAPNIKHAVPTDAASVAVLPFVNMSSDPEQEYFSDGLSEEILNALARTPGLYVPARTSSFQFKGKSGDVAKFAAMLGVAAVLEGSVRKSGGRVRITAQLVNAKDGYHLWSQTYDRELKDIFAIQDEVSTAIAQALQVKLTARQALATSSASPTRNLDAYEAYLLGRHELNEGQANSIGKSIEHFRVASTLDPQFAAAHAALAVAILQDSESRMGMTWTAERLGAIQRAQAALEQARSIAPDSAEVLAAAGFLQAVQQNFEGALSLYDKSLAVNPSDGQVLAWRIGTLRALERDEQLLAASQEAVRRDPLSIPSLESRTRILLTLGRRSEADHVVARIRDLDETTGQLWLAELASFDGDRPAAIQHCIAANQSGSDPGCGLRALAALGLREEVLARAELPGVANAAAAHWVLGEYREACRLALIAAKEDPVWWEWDLVSWLWYAGEYRQSWQFSVQARESDRKGLGYTSFGRDPRTLLAAADSARRVGEFEDARYLRDRAATRLAALDRAAAPFQPSNEFDRAMLRAYDGQEDEAAALLIAALPRGYTSWRNALAAPLFEQIRERPDFKAAIAKQRDTLDRQRVEVLHILCRPGRVSKGYEPVPATCDELAAKSKDALLEPGRVGR
jgi:TolB-like protein